MSKIVIYARSASENPMHIRQQERVCREYFEEIGATDAGSVTAYGRASTGIPQLIDCAAEHGAADIVVTDLARLGRNPDTVIEDCGLLDDAGLTVHVANGMLSGPITDHDLRYMMLKFTAFDADRTKHETRIEN